MLYLVTDRKIAKKDFYHIVEESVAGGIDGIILREKDLSQGELKIMADKLKSLVKESKTELIINGDLSVAKAVEADGYHIGFNRLIKGNEKELREFHGKLGVSIHSLREAKEAEKRGADYLLAGHIFKTSCKEGLEPRGIGWLKEIINEVGIPVIAIGGIHPGTIGKLQSTKVYGVAVRSLIMQSLQPKETVVALQQLWTRD